MHWRLYRAKRRSLLLFLGIVLLALGLNASLFVIDVTEYGIVVRFGRVRRVIDEPGLQVKLPAPVDRVVRLPKRLLRMQPATTEYLTQDKKNIVVYSLVTWKIADPRRFLERVVTRAQAEARLADIVGAEIGTVLGSYPSAALIAAHGQDIQFQAMVARMQTHAHQTALDNYGIAVMDVWLRQLQFPEENRASVFARMQAERGRIALKYRSEGEREFTKLVAVGERQKRRILAEAYKEAERLKGEGDAEAMRIYAAAFRTNPQFYKFIRTLEGYEKFLDEHTTVLFPADAEILQLLNRDAKPTALE
jgi:modulator of FtsH protease HflC